MSYVCGPSTARVISSTTVVVVVRLLQASSQAGLKIKPSGIGRFWSGLATLKSKSSDTILLVMQLASRHRGQSHCYFGHHLHALRLPFDLAAAALVAAAASVTAPLAAYMTAALL